MAAADREPQEHAKKICAKTHDKSSSMWAMHVAAWRDPERQVRSRRWRRSLRSRACPRPAHIGTTQQVGKQAEQSEESVQALAMPATALRSASASFAFMLSSTCVSVAHSTSRLLLSSLIFRGDRSSPAPTAPIWMASSFTTTKSVTASTKSTSEHVSAARVDRPSPLTSA